MSGSSHEVVNGEVPHIVIPHVSRAPVLSDFATGKAREAELAISEFTQMDPADGKPATHATTAYLSFDEHNLYVGWVCKDDPAKVRARIAKRKMISSDDRVSINIDTFHDRKHAYWFDVNPYGVQLDGRTTDGVGDDSSWESLWYTEGAFTPDGYVILETIPMRSLRFPKGERQVWGISLLRFVERNGEMDTWPAMTHRRDPQWVGQFADMEIDRNISPGRNMQFIPYGMGSYDRYLDPVTGHETEAEHTAGLDAKFVLKDSFTLDTTINPDYSQIDSDQPKVTVNQRFEVIYPENRPFFMENASIFSEPEQLFFSRDIVSPQFGARLTGSTGRWGVGVVVADDRGPGEALAAGDPLRHTHAVDVVARVEREFQHQSHIGAAITSYDFGGASNRVGALDLRMALPKNWYVFGMASTSTTTLRDGTHSAGPGYVFGLQNFGLHASAWANFTDRSPGMNFGLGYLNRVDLRTVETGYGYQWRPKHSPVVSYGPAIDVGRDADHQGTLQDWWVTPRFSVTLPRNSTASASHSEWYEVYQGVGFRQNASEIYVASQWFKWLSGDEDVSVGKAINYYPAAGLKPFLADSVNASTSLTVRPMSRLRLDETYLYSRLGADKKSLPSPDVPAMAIFNNHILRSKGNFQFNRDMSASAIVDYLSVLPNPVLVTADYAKQFDTTLLFTYLPHPGTAVYVGYATTLQNVAFDGQNGGAFRRTDFPGTTTDGQVFAKFSYLLRF